MHTIFDLYLPLYSINNDNFNNDNLFSLQNKIQIIQNHINYICENNIYNISKEIKLDDFNKKIKYKQYFKKMLKYYLDFCIYYFKKKLT